MKIYIKGMGNISPQQTWGDETLLSQTFDYKGDRLTCHEPAYEQWIDVRSLRRMSRIIKMGVAAGSMALKEAGITNPDGIITGTGYGCLDDTGSFLTKMVINDEQALNPTPFIQSTHNTIGAQLALLLQCQAYNQTYTQGAFSFESSLLDATLQLQENPSQLMLVGGVDEITDISHAIQQRFGKFNSESRSSLDLLKSSEGTLNGEGASFVVLSGEPGEHDKASLEAMTMFYKHDEATLRNGIKTFISEAGMQSHEIDFVLSGACGIREFDSPLNAIVDDIFPDSSKGFFKHLCGEYATASSFALWLAAQILHAHHVPEMVIFHDAGRPVENVLIHNQYFGTYHSLILLKSCRVIL